MKRMLLLAVVAALAGAPAALADALLDWIAQTEPAALDDEAWRALLRRRAQVRPRAA